MNADTFVLPSGPPRIGPLPSPGTYRAAPDRCILEVSRRLDPLAVRRRRDTTIPLTLRTRVVDREDDRLLIIGTGHAHRVRLLLAADFR